MSVSTDRNIVTVAEADKPIQLPNGTEKTVQAWKLPQRVDVTLRDGSSVQVEVLWDLTNLSYDPAARQEQNFIVRGELKNLPAGVTNTSGVTVGVAVQVQAAPVTIVDMEPVAPVTVANGTSAYDLRLVLPAVLKATLSDNSQQDVNINWQIYDTSYDPTQTTEQTFTIYGYVMLNQGMMSTDNLRVSATVTAASAEASGAWIKSVYLERMYYEVDSASDMTPAEIGLPARLNATLGDNSQVAIDVNWVVKPHNGGPNNVSYYTAYGTFTNVPAGVIDPGITIRMDIVTYNKKDIKQVNFLELQVANGAAKTVEALGLPAQIEVTLYDGSETSVPVSWDLSNLAYNPAVPTSQNFPVFGTFVNLPAGVSNGKNVSAYVYVTVLADPNALQVVSFPDTQYMKAPVGSDKTAEGFGLPAQVEVSLSNNTKIDVDVSWDVESINYDPNSTVPLSMWILGRLVNLPQGVYNSANYTVWANVTTQVQSVISISTPWILLPNGVPKTVEGLQLPQQVDVTLQDYSVIPVNVTWNVAFSGYQPASRLEQSFYVSGTFVNLPKGVVTYGYGPQAYVTVQANENNKYVESISPLSQITVENGVPKTTEGFSLPAQVEVTLSDGTRIYADVSWNTDTNYNGQAYDPDYKAGRQNLSIRGTLIHLPDGVFVSNSLSAWASVVVKDGIRDIHEATMFNVQVPHGTLKNESYLGLPATVEVTLSDNRKAELQVQWDTSLWGGWNTYDPLKDTYQTIQVRGQFINLPAWIKNPQSLMPQGTVEVFSALSVKEVYDVPVQPVHLVNGFQLPSQVEVMLDNGTTVASDVVWKKDAWYSGGSFYFMYDKITGHLQLPEGVSNSREVVLQLDIADGNQAYIGKYTTNTAVSPLSIESLPAFNFPEGGARLTKLKPCLMTEARLSSMSAGTAACSRT